jgi:predicted heme/steroid binding protein
MAVNFSAQFRINEKTQSRVLRLTDTSTGFTLAKGNFSVTFPDGSTRIKTDFLSPDISAAGGFVDILLVTDSTGAVITGNYKIDFVALDTSLGGYNLSRTTNFNWIKPTKNIVDGSDVLLPEVKFFDNTSYLTIGSYTGTLTRTFTTVMPSNTPQSGTTVTGTGNVISPIFSGNYYEGVYTARADVSVAYTHSTDTWTSALYIDLLQQVIDVRRAPTQYQLIGYINTYHAAIEAYETTNDTQFDILNEEYDLVMALYSHLIARFESSTLDGSEPILAQLLDILRPYNTHTYTSAPLVGFSIEADFFSISDGTNTDSVPLKSTLNFLGSNGITTAVTNNTVTTSPTYGTTSGTIAQGNDSRFHSPVTVGTGNGLSLSTQVLSLSSATTSSAGAMSASDKTKLDSVAAGAQPGTVTSVGVSMPAAFTVNNSPVTTSGTIAITATGTTLQYMRGDGTVATLNTTVVTEGDNLYYTQGRFDTALAAKSTTNLAEGTNLYFTNLRARQAISLTTTGVSGAATYNSTTGVLNIPAYEGGVTSFNTRTGAITLTSGDVTGALGYTPYNATNPAGYTNNVGTVTSVGGTGTVSGLTLTGSVTTSGNLTLGGALSLTSSNVTTALGYTPESTLNKGVAGGYASLDGAGLVPSTQLPSYVDDVLEYTNLAGFPATGTTGKIYVALDNNKIYRWSGSAYIEVSPTVGTIWGGITGTLANQTDLQSALDAKQDDITLTTTGTSGAATFVGNTLNIPQYEGGVTSFNTRTGAITLTSSDVTTALTFTPYNATNPNAYIALTALSAGTGISYNNTTGVITNTITQYTDALARAAISLTTTGTSGAATYNSTTGVLNIPEYQGGVTSFNTRTGAITLSSGDVTGALGFTPYDATNPNSYIALTALSSTATGLTYTNTTGVFSLTTGYAIPTTIKQSNWDDAYTFVAAFPSQTGNTGKFLTTDGSVLSWASSAAAGVTSFNTRTGDITLSSSDVTTALGYTPVTNARTLTINGTTYDLTANRSWTVSGTLAAGGTAGQILSKIDATNYNTQWIDNYATQLKHEVKLGATIAKGKAVYVSSADGTNMIVSAASNASEATSSKTLGLLETGGVTNDIVKVITEGLLAGLDTSTATAGDPVWLGTSGDLIFGLANKPVAPAHLVFIGIVTRVQSNNGEIFVKVQNGFEIEELHNVLFTSKADKDVMYYDNATSLWKNAQLTSVLGYTPYNATNPNNYIALTALSSTATGLTYTNTTGVFSLTSGYVIPTTSSASNWDTAYGWGNHASAGYLTTSSAASTYQPLDADLTAIAAISGTSGLLKKTAANTWSLDTSTYLTSITSGDVTTALGYTPVTNARTLTINGTAYDLSANRSWTISAGTTLNGTGFVKASGTTISYDNSTYVPTNGTGASGTWSISVSGNSATTSQREFNYLRVNSNNHLYLDYNYGCTTVGVYSASRYQGVFAMGGAYMLPVDGTGPGNLYGLAWSHPNAGGQAGFLSTHGLLVMENGVTNAALANGIWTRGDVTAYSDARVKENVQVIENALEKIHAIRGVTFTRNDREDTDTRFAGVIAQEVLPVFPEVVTESKDGTYSVAYGNMAGLFIEAFKEQQVQLMQQKAQIDELVEIVKTLKGL